MSRNVSKFFGSVVALGVLAAAAPALASPVTINFSTVSVGTVLSNQFAGQGVTFTPNALSGTNPITTDPWATNTDLTVVSATGTDVGGFGTLVSGAASGNIVRSFGAWLGENGDPSFRISFSSAVSNVSLDFVGITDFFNTGLRAIGTDGVTVLGSVLAPGTGQHRLTLNFSGIGSVIVTPGSFLDWVGIDNLTFTPASAPPPPTGVSEPASLALLGAGLLGLAAARRRRTA
jgi:hypothetical protein